MPDTRSPDGPDDGADTTLLGELLSLPPRLASRTIAQVQASQHLLSMLVCSGQADRSEDSGASGQGPTAHDGERHDTAEPGSAEPGSAEPGSAEPGSAEPGAGEPLAEPVDVLSILEGADEDSVEAEPEVDTGSAESPPVDDLPIPGYDSLAASQVVPRLTTLSESELAAIGAYEAAHRGRRTILNRVTQLQAQ